jgi:hypothetical protein
MLIALDLCYIWYLLKSYNALDSYYTSDSVMIAGSSFRRTQVLSCFVYCYILLIIFTYFQFYWFFSSVHIIMLDSWRAKKENLCKQNTTLFHTWVLTCGWINVGEDWVCTKIEVMVLTNPFVIVTSLCHFGVNFKHYIVWFPESHFLG